MKRLFLIALLFLAGCQGRYASLGNTMSACGFKSSPYSSFHNCMNEKIVVNEKAEQDDYYNNSQLEIRSLLDSYAQQIEKKKLTEDDAYEQFRQFVNLKIIEEQQSAQTALAITGAMTLGVAAAACANNGGCYSPYNNYNNQGCCSWHGGISHCDVGAGRLVCLDGEYSPTCGC